MFMPGAPMGPLQCHPPPDPSGMRSRWSSRDYLLLPTTSYYDLLGPTATYQEPQGGRGRGGPAGLEPTCVHKHTNLCIHTCTCTYTSI